MPTTNALALNINARNAAEAAAVLAASPWEKGLEAVAAFERQVILSEGGNAFLRWRNGQRRRVAAALKAAGF